MVQDVIKVEDDKWTDYYALMVQRTYEKEIKEAVEQVKQRRVYDAKIQIQPKRRKRGYWTPSGFAWFKQGKQKVAPPGGKV